MQNNRAPFFQSPPFHSNFNQPPQQQPFNQQSYYPNQPQHMEQPQQMGITPYEQFAKPQQPDWKYYFQQPTGPNGPGALGGQSGPVGPGGPQNMGWNQPPKGIMQYFQDKDGQLDMDKMLGTVGQMANTVQQVSPLIKSFGSFMKGFK